MSSGEIASVSLPARGKSVCVNGAPDPVEADRHDDQRQPRRDGYCHASRARRADFYPGCQARRQQAPQRGIVE